MLGPEAIECWTAQRKVMIVFEVPKNWSRSFVFLPESSVPCQSEQVPDLDDRWRRVNRR